MVISGGEVRRFAGYLRSEEKSGATVEKYAREAERFSAWLEGRAVTKELAVEYKGRLSETRTAAGVNGAVSALNCLFAFLGLHGCRLKAAKVQRRVFRDEARELTQAEYRRLLAAAKSRRDQRLLLVMEAICSTGIRVGELRFFTVEAVRLGRVEVSNKGKTRTVLLPGKLQKLLLRYARERGVTAGPVFVTRGGRPLDRSNIWKDMKALCAAADVAETKVFPHNLRHLFARCYYQLEKDIVRFTDVRGHWAEEAIAYVSAGGIMTGTGENTFAPESAMTRAMVWTVLARMSGQSVDGGDPWYALAQSWAVAASVSDGADANGSITREQLVTMLYRFAGSPEVGADALALLEQYADSASVSGWARPAMAWAVSQGVINGVDGALAPQSAATRAQVAAILARCCQSAE